MRVAVAALLTALALAAGNAAATSTASGLRGVVKQTKTPVCLQDTPCDGLARGLTLSFARAGHSPVRSTTHDDGTYSVRLGAGRYSVRVAGDDVAALRPRIVLVRRGTFTRVNFFVDTGIRQP